MRFHFTDPEGESYLTITFDRKDGKKDVMGYLQDVLLNLIQNTVNLVGSTISRTAKGRYGAL